MRPGFLHKFEMFAFVAELLATKLETTSCDGPIITCLVDATMYRPTPLKSAELKELEIQFILLLKGNVRSVTAVEIVYRVLGTDHPCIDDCLNLLRNCYFDAFFSLQAPSLVAFAAMQCTWTGPVAELDHYGLLLNIHNRQREAASVQKRMISVERPRWEPPFAEMDIGCHRSLSSGRSSDFIPVDFISDTDTKESSFYCDEPYDLGYLEEEEDEYKNHVYTDPSQTLSRKAPCLMDDKCIEESDKENTRPVHWSEQTSCTTSFDIWPTCKEEILDTKKARMVYTRKLFGVTTLTKQCTQISRPTQQKLQVQYREGEVIQRTRYRNTNPINKSVDEQIIGAEYDHRIEHVLREYMADTMQSTADFADSTIARVA
ncbi:hypothetical protein SARC_14144 [Sphaeroforma arctica JP610]|uniref:Uncharacterized protein n=1 Tax=Sphaeroforma arctica JP610 TaxID=667725 RepID=A0A0L0F9T4_9EUKA|nr:hypothetical protein SARC_14144 [Sphaeroforma arctica JP610]KNC73296.1 hypothetical protein SARC_14144 [Sphaeroforma arctica JP610]|eukprot:XP_014147198.1 hypothetical protein SARC_14144 [Sphaeroforma arctica JP610]